MTLHSIIPCMINKVWEIQNNQAILIFEILLKYFIICQVFPQTAIFGPNPFRAPKPLCNLNFACVA